MTILNRRSALIGAGAFAVPTLARTQGAADWPKGQIKIIVPFPPGGSTDPVARIIQAKLIELTGWNIIIDNKPGGTGAVGSAIAAKSAPDGYTVLLYSVHGAVAVSAYKDLSYDIEKDLIPVTTAAIFPDVLVAANRVPAKTLPELITFAKAYPGKINCGSAGNGTSRHLSCEMFKLAAGITATHVPYKGTGPATTALLAGEIDYIFEALGSASSFIRAGTVKPIMVTSAKRSPSFPEIPTAIESGLPGFEITSWYGLWFPAGTPRDIVMKMQAAVVKAFQDPDLKATWFKLGAEPGGSSPEEFRDLVSRDVAKWSKVVREAKITVN